MDGRIKRSRPGCDSRRVCRLASSQSPDHPSTINQCHVKVAETQKPRPLLLRFPTSFLIQRRLLRQNGNYMSESDIKVPGFKVLATSKVLAGAVFMLICTFRPQTSSQNSRVLFQSTRTQRRLNRSRRFDDELFMTYGLH